MPEQHSFVLLLAIIALIGAMSPLWRRFSRSDPDLVWRKASIFREMIRRVGWSR